MSSRRAFAILCAASLVACGADETTGVEPPSGPTGCAAGEVPVGEDCVPAGVGPTDCGAGFESDGAQGCEPILPAQRCEAGTMAVPGETSCHDVAPCADGTWGDVPGEATTQWVDESYQGGGSDGTQDHPWSTIQQGIDAAADGGIVGIAAGSYPENLVIEGKAVRLWGRCPRLVEVAGSAPEPAAIELCAGAGGSELRRIAVAGSARGVLATDAGTLRLEQVWIHDTADVGVLLVGTEGSLRDVLVESVHSAGLLIQASTAAIERVVVRDCQPGAWPARGIVVVDTAEGASEATIATSLVEANVDIGLQVGGSTARVSNTVVRDTQPAPAGDRGWGVAAQGNPTTGRHSDLRVDTSLVAGNHAVGCVTMGGQTTIERTVVRDTLSRQSDQGAGVGISIQADSSTHTRGTATVRQSLVELAREVAVQVSGADATFEGLAVRDTLPNPLSGRYGIGVGVVLSLLTGERSTATLRWSSIERSVETGVHVRSSDVILAHTLIDVIAVQPADGLFGDGLAVVADDAGANASVSQSTIAHGARAGLAIFGGTCALSATQLECNAIHINGEQFGATAPVLVNMGANSCGCDGEVANCQVLGTGLYPPGPPPEL